MHVQPHTELPDYLNNYTHAVIGAAIEVHRYLGPGFLERTYEDALVIEFGLRGISYERQLTLPITYKDQIIASPCVDLLVEGELVVELKAVDSIVSVHRAQVLSYLKAGAFPLGLLINFNVPSLRDGIARVILSSPSFAP